MKRYYLIFFVTAYVFFSGCNSRSGGDDAGGESEFYTIDFEPCFETKRQMFLSEIADTVEYWTSGRYQER
ncbi:MAG: hypothetical protein LBG96_04390 [Tannerella sp.]|nr:hypothetical protein [Tannerella sp.]